MSLVTRFAPSPTGYLHLGHALAAVTAWRAARQAGGRFLLRLEDIDTTRCRPEYAEAIQADLRWLGIDWDGDVRVQSRHFSEYRAVLATLEQRDLLYPCFCTRADIARAGAAPHAPDGSALYPGTCRVLSRTERAARIAAGLAHAWRLDMARAGAATGPNLSFEEAGRGTIACQPASFGDVVLARRDMPASYHLCVVHDDAVQGVTLVTRGADLLPATDVHRLLQAILGYPAPRYAHHPLLTDNAGKRLAKRDHARTLRSMAEAGARPADILEKLSRHRAIAMPPPDAG